MKSPSRKPPEFFLRFFRWFCKPELKKYIEGDLLELHAERLDKGMKKGKLEIYH